MDDLAGIRKPFEGKIAFTFSPAKTAACLEWVGGFLPAGTLVQDAMLALLVAERSHLNDYGRPIFGATYRLCGDEVTSNDISTVLARPAADARWSLQDGRILAPDSPDVPWDMSPSDAEHINEALHLVARSRTEALAIAQRSCIDGMVDYSLMLDDESDVMLRMKLENLVDWGRYFHLGN